MLDVEIFINRQRSMKIYLRGYYGYKNFGDELLLLGLLPYLEKRYGSTHVCIETPDEEFLCSWITKNKKILEDLGYTGIISYTNNISFLPQKNSMLVLGGGEVLTDARRFPYNGRNYFFRHILWFVFSSPVFVGGVGNVNNGFTSLLYHIFANFSKEFVVRDPSSFEVISRYSGAVLQYHDFAYDVLKILSPDVSSDSEKTYGVVNINRHILTDVNMSEICGYFDPQKSFLQKIYFVPASVGIDDADSDLYQLLSSHITGLELYNWTRHSLTETIEFILGSKRSLATRLHVALIYAYYNKPFKVLIYQEKVQRMLDSIDEFRDTV